MPSARLLDLSRLISRVGRGPLTGIDRVELAYLAALMAAPEPLFALVRVAGGFALLAPAATATLRDHLTGQAPWGRPDLLARLTRRTAPARGAAEATVRRLALGRARDPGLARLLRRHLPPGTAYLNVGHSNLRAAVFAALRQVPGATVAVMIHDAIPLDHPDFASEGMPAAFAGRLHRVGAAADLVIYPSASARRSVEAHLARLGRVPPGMVAPLGIDIPRPDPAALPTGLDLAPPFFVALGTIEPRKNLGFLLDLWADLARAPPASGLPRLYLVGRRGWAAPGLIARLDALPADGPVRELGPLPDAAVAALLQRSAGLLFPSLAEGYGLPPLEAAALGVPVVLNDLAVYRETLGNSAVYASVNDRYPWRKAITDLAEGAGRAETARHHHDDRPLPRWEDHFKPVLRLT